MRHCKLLLLFFILIVPSFCYSQQPDISDSAFCHLASSSGIYNDDFIRKTLYTWTTSEQIEELRKNKKLLTKSMSPINGYSLFDITIRDTAFKNFLIARLLQQSQFAKKRFAWANCWATSMGLDDEKYGDQLIRIDLKDNAIIGYFDPKYLADPFQFYDMKGNKLKADYVIENQDRLGVIYHINSMEVSRTQQQTKRKGTYYQYVNRYKKEKWYIEFREFVVVNEQMINWSYGTEEIKNEIAAEINFLKQLLSSGFAHQMGYQNDCELVKNGNAYNNVYCAFETNKCFNTDDYLFNRERILKIISHLQSVMIKQSAPIIN